MTDTTDQSRNSTCKIEQKLKAIIADQPASIRAFVADEALNYHSDDPSQMFHDLQRSGCQSGLIGSMIYYQDTHTFFDCHYDEIEDLREEYEDSVGQPISIVGDLKNWLAWFAFEETAFQLANELNLEI